jgi:hypothetical protein
MRCLSSDGVAALHESAFGPKRTSPAAPHMSAIRGKADIARAAGEPKGKIVDAMIDGKGLKNTRLP